MWAVALFRNFNGVSLTLGFHIILTLGFHFNGIVKHYILTLGFHIQIHGFNGASHLPLFSAVHFQKTINLLQREDNLATQPHRQQYKIHV